MKIKNNILVLLLVVCMFLTNAPCVFAEEVPDEGEEIINPEDAEESLDDPFIYEEDKLTPDDAEENSNFNEPEEEDVPETIEYNTISSLNEYGLLEQLGMKIPDVPQNELLQRDKATMYFYFFQNAAESLSNQITYFDDVPYENEYIGYINYCCELRYVAGTGDKKFSPHKEITVAEFATVVLRIAGYRDYVEALGGGLDKYLLIANRYDLLDGVSAKNYDKMTEKDAIRILYNGLHLPVCNESAISNKGISYSINSDYTVLQQKFNVEFGEAVVCSTENAAIFGYASSGEDSVSLLINGEYQNFNISGFSAERFLGQRVHYYKNSQDRIIFLKTKYEPNKIVLSFENLQMSSDRTQITYKDESDKPRKLKIALDATFIYNGKQDNSITSSELNLPNTRIELVDVNNNNVYDVLYIEQSETLIVEALPDPAFTFGTNIDKYDYPFPMYPEYVMEELDNSEYYRSYIASERTTGRMVELDPKSDDYELTLLRNGAEIEYKDLRINDLLSICESRDGKRKIVYVSRTRVEDTISTIDYADNRIETAGGKEFICSFDLKNSNLLGKYVTLYIDAYGYACAYRLSAQIEPAYGYLMDVGETRDTTSFETVMEAKIYTMDGKIEIYQTAKKVYNNDSRTTINDFITYFNETGHQLIKYSLDADGNLKRFYTSYTPQGYSLHSEKPIFVLNEHYNGSTDNYGKYKSTNLELEYDLQSVKRFQVITDQNGNINDESISIVTSFKSDQTADLRVYDAKTGKIASVVVCTVKDEDVETYLGINDFYFVVGDILNDEDGKFLRGKHRRNSNKPFLYEYYEETPGLFDEIAPGDVIKIIWYRVDENNNYVISKFEKLFTLKSKGNEDPQKTICADWTYDSENKPITNGRIAHNKQMYGTVKAMSSLSNDDIEHRQFSVVLQPEGTASDEDCYAFTFSRISTGTFRIFRFNSEEGTLEDYEGYILKPGDKIFVTTNYYTANFIVVYE